MVKKIILLTLVIMLVSSFININFVAAGGLSFDDVVTEANNWINIGENAFNSAGTTGVTVSGITNIILPVAQALTTIGAGILLIVAAVMGIKWITANPEEQAKLKQQSIGLVVAAVVILGAYTIWSIALKIVSNF